MPESATAHLQQARISKFFRGGGPQDTPLSGEGGRESGLGELRKGREGVGGLGRKGEKGGFGERRSPKEKFTTTRLCIC